MKKYNLFVQTRKNPIARLCTFTVTAASNIAWKLESETMELWIDPVNLERILSGKRCLHPKDCLIFKEV